MPSFQIELPDDRMYFFERMAAFRGVTVGEYIQWYLAAIGPGPEGGEGAAAWVAAFDKRSAGLPKGWEMDDSRESIYDGGESRGE